MNSPLMLLSGIPVELPLLFDQGYSFFYNSPGASKARARVSKTRQTKHASQRQSGSMTFNDYRNYMDQVKGSNPDLSNLTTHLMRGIGQRVERYYERYQSIPPHVLNTWKHRNMPYIVLSSTKVPSVKTVIKLHLSEVTRERIDYELGRGMIVRLTDVPKNFSLLGYEVYGNGTIDNDAILGDVSLLDKIGSTDILSRTFSKRDKSEYSGSSGLEWLAELEALVDGDVISTINVRKSEPLEVSTSMWYNVKVAITMDGRRERRLYRGMVITPDPITSTPVRLSRDQTFNFLHNFIPTEAVTIELPGDMGSQGSIEILESTLSSAGMRGLVAYGVTTLTLDPGRVYYLIGKKGSGKSTKIALLKELGNVEDSDDYGVFLTWYLGREGALSLTFDELMDWVPTGDSFAKAVNDFMLGSHDYEKEKSIFLMYAETILASEAPVSGHIQKLVRFINMTMDHRYIGVQRYADLRAQHYDPGKPTFVMCHSTSETGFRRTPDDTLALSEIINSERIVGARNRGVKQSGASVDEAELLLYYAYATGISTINKILPFAVILEQLRRVSGDPLFGALRIRTGDETSDSNVQ